MNTEDPIQKGLDIASIVAKEANRRSALLADVIRVVEDYLDARIVLREVSHLKPAEAIRVSWDKHGQKEITISIAEVTPENLEMVRCALAHELGHLILGQDIHPTKDTFSDADDPSEQMISAFAAGVLATRSKVLQRSRPSREALIALLASTSSRLPKAKTEEIAEKVATLFQEAKDANEQKSVSAPLAHAADLKVKREG